MSGEDCFHLCLQQLLVACILPQFSGSNHFGTKTNATKLLKRENNCRYLG